MGEVRRPRPYDFLVVAQFEALSELSGFPLRAQRLKCLDLPEVEKLLTAEDAEDPLSSQRNSN
jgi:hypothetical protein